MTRRRRPLPLTPAERHHLDALDAARPCRLECVACGARSDVLTRGAADGADVRACFFCVGLGGPRVRTVAA